MNPRAHTARDGRTRERILTAAEQIFADRGFEPASIRAIARRARVSLPVLYYYFGSKTGLIRAVLERRFGPLRTEHQQALARLQPSPGSPPPELETILEAMIRPVLRLAEADARQGSVVMHLIGRVIADPTPAIQDWFQEHIRNVRQGFLELLARHLPQLPRAVLLWRYEFIWGALAFMLCNRSWVVRKTDGVCDPLDTGTVLPQFVQYCVAGLTAPAPRGSRARPRP